MTTRHIVPIAIGIALAAVSAGELAAAPQTFNTALPVATGESLFREQFVYMQASDDPSAADHDLDVRGAASVLGYGATREVAVFGVLPYLDKRLALTGPSGRRMTRRTRGIGDAQLFARYTLWQRDRPGENARIAPFLGLELPTGDDDDRDSAGRLPPALQLGSGSWDPFVGLIATYQTLDYQLDAQLSYKRNTEANDFELGDEARLDASLQYRLWPRELGAGVPGFLYGVIEANLLHEAKHEIGGSSDPNSGGTTGFLSPGLQYVTKRWVLEAIVQFPVVQNRGGTALENDFTVRAGFRMNF